MAFRIRLRVPPQPEPPEHPSKKVKREKVDISECEKKAAMLEYQQKKKEKKKGEKYSLETYLLEQENDPNGRRLPKLRTMHTALKKYGQKESKQSETKLVATSRILAFRNPQLTLKSHHSFCHLDHAT